jgi:hypothetical protein
MRLLAAFFYWHQTKLGLRINLRKRYLRMINRKYKQHLHLPKVYFVYSPILYQNNHLMKKILLASAFLLAAFTGEAQKQYVVWGNHTGVEIDIIFYGDNFGTCTPNFQTTPYIMGTDRDEDANIAAWTTMASPPPNLFNGATLIYKVSGIPVSTYDIDFCTATSGGYTSFSFPGGPGLRYYFMTLPQNYELFVEY